MTIRSTTLLAFVGLLAIAAPATGQIASKNLEHATPQYSERYRHVEEISTRLDRARNVDVELGASSIEARFFASVVAAPEAYRILNELEQDWDTQADDWQNGFLTTYTRNEAGFVTQRLVETWDAGGQTWANWSRDVYTLDDNNFATETLSEDWDPSAAGGQGDWAPSGRRKLEVDDLGRTLVSSNESWDDETGEYELSTRNTYTYDGSSTQWETSTFESVSFTTGEFGFSLRYTFTYDDDGNTTSRFYERYDRDAGEWENNGLKQWTYDSNGEEVLDLELDWDDDAGDWVNSYQTVTEYTSNPTQAVETQQSWDAVAGDWVNEDRRVTTIEPDLITDTQQEWDPTANNGQETGPTSSNQS